MIGFIMSPWHRDVKLETRLINLISAQLVREKRVQIPPPLQGKCKSQKKKSLKFTIGMNGAGTWLIGLNGTKTLLYLLLLLPSLFTKITLMEINLMYHNLLHCYKLYSLFHQKYFGRLILYLIYHQILGLRSALIALQISLISLGKEI